MRNILLLGACVLALSTTACRTTGDAKASWNKVIRNCAVSDLNGPNILYFGPSNAVGTGSIWRKDAQGVFRLRYDLSQMPDPKNFFAPANDSSCSGSASSKFVFGADASLDAQPVSADMKADLSRAKKVEAKASSMAWVPIQEGPFRDYVNGLPANAGPRIDLMAGDKYVLTRALRVSGFSTTLEFSSDVAAGLHAKYNGALPANLAGNVGGGLNASWTGQNTLTLTSNGPFYIAGEFQPYLPSGFAAAGHVLGPIIVVPPNTVVARDSL
jgi:hypothetical protein